MAFHVRGGDLLADLTNNVSCPDTVHRTSLMCGCNTTPESLPGHGITLYYADLSSPQTDTKFPSSFCCCCLMHPSSRCICRRLSRLDSVSPYAMQKRDMATPSSMMGRALEAFGPKAKVIPMSFHLATVTSHAMVPGLVEDPSPYGQHCSLAVAADCRKTYTRCNMQEKSYCQARRYDMLGRP